MPSARAAQVLVREDRRLPHRDGWATIGYAGLGKGLVRLDMRGFPWDAMAWTVSHELGHVPGLGHATGCNVMSYTAVRDCRSFGGELWEWRCRLQERGDLLGVHRLYGGTFRVRAAPHCLKSPAAGRARPVVTPGDRTRVATLSWAPLARARSYRLARSEPGGPCPADHHEAREVRGRSYADELLPWQQRAPARYCYAIWSLNKDGAPTGPVHVRVD